MFHSHSKFMLNITVINPALKFTLTCHTVSVQKQVNFEKIVISPT